MKAMRPRLLALCLTAAATLSGCSLLLDFDPQRRPCDEQGGCLEGFLCQGGVCVPKPTCGPCATGERCAPSGRCVLDTCDVHACPAGYQCVAGEGGASCVAPMAPALGHPCSADAECALPEGGGARVCLRGAVEVAETGALRPGICVELCDAASACVTPGATCQTLPMGLGAGTARMCLTERLVTPCASDERCRDDRLVCTLYDHPSTGPATLCDPPLEGGAKAGEACVAVATPGAQLCANGLCAPQSPEPGVTPTCTTPCDQGTCAVGSCMLAPFRIQDTVRHVPLCVETASRCVDCTSSPRACGTEAPRCVALPNSSACLSECTPGATGAPPCPAGLTCVTLDTGISVCGESAREVCWAVSE